MKKKTILHKSGCSSYADGSELQQMWNNGESICKLRQRCGNPWCVTESHIALVFVAYVPQPAMSYNVKEIFELYVQQGYPAVLKKYDLTWPQVRKLFREHEDEIRL